MTKHVSQPNVITRKELRSELRALTSDLKRELVTKVELKRALKNHPTHDDLKRALKNHPTHDDLKASEARIIAEMARHIRAALDETRIWFATLDDKYKDLPPRVARLEAHAGIE